MNTSWESLGETVTQIQHQIHEKMTVSENMIYLLQDNSTWVLRKPCSQDLVHLEPGAGTYTAECPIPRRRRSHHGNRWLWCCSRGEKTPEKKGSWNYACTGISVTTRHHFHDRSGLKFFRFFLNFLTEMIIAYTVELLVLANCNLIIGAFCLCLHLTSKVKYVYRMLNNSKNCLSTC